MGETLEEKVNRLMNKAWSKYIPRAAQITERNLQVLRLQRKWLRGQSNPNP